MRAGSCWPARSISAPSPCPGRADPVHGAARGRWHARILEASIYSKGVTYAAIVDASGIVIAHYDPPSRSASRSRTRRCWRIWSSSAGSRSCSEIFFGDGRTYEVREPLRLGDSPASPHRHLDAAHQERPAGDAAAVFITRAVPARRRDAGRVAARAVAAAAHPRVAQRPYAPGARRARRRRSTCRRTSSASWAGVQRGEREAARADARPTAGPKPSLDSIVEHLADAVGIFGPTATRCSRTPRCARCCRGASAARRIQPLPRLVGRTLDSRAASEPSDDDAAVGRGRGGARDWLVTAHRVDGPDDRLLGVMVVARDLDALGAVESTISYSRKLAALGRLIAGVAHEVKNPLNAMTIHLELLKGKLARAAPGDGPTVPARRSAESGRRSSTWRHRQRDPPARPGGAGLPEVHAARGPAAAAGAACSALIDEIRAGRRARADAHGVGCRWSARRRADVNGDPGSLRQALLNLAINACQAMTHGGTLRLAARPRRGAASRSSSKTPAPASRRSTCRGSSICTSRPRSTAAASDCRWSIARCSCTTARSKCSPRSARGPTFRILLPQA